MESYLGKTLTCTLGEGRRIDISFGPSVVYVEGLPFGAFLPHLLILVSVNLLDGRFPFVAFVKVNAIPHGVPTAICPADADHIFQFGLFSSLQQFCPRTHRWLVCMSREKSVSASEDSSQDCGGAYQRETDREFTCQACQLSMWS